MQNLNLQARKTKDLSRNTIGFNMTQLLRPILGVYAMQYILVLL